MRHMIQNAWLPLLLAASACKPAPQADSQVQSLDNFVDQTSGKGTAEHSCGMDYTTDRALPKRVQKLAASNFIEASGASRGEVLGTLAAVPPGLLAPLALAGGKIFVASTAAAAVEACANASLSAEEKKAAKGKPISTCWTENPVRIVLPPEAKAIRAGLLRATAYFYTQFFVDRASRAAAPFDQPAWKKELAAFADVRSGLMEAFVVDVELKDPAAAKKLRDAFSPDLLANYIYAEALDSYYCSRAMTPKSTRGIFRQRFPVTWKIFTDRANPNSPVSLFGS